MDRLTPTLIIVGIVVVSVVLMLLGWRSRRRRQGDLGAPAAVPTVLSPMITTASVAYVATTLADQALERVAVHGLGFRARADIAVHRDGLVVSIRGRDPFFIPASDVRSATTATWAIDRAVEPGGLVCIGWTLAATPVDLYVRLDDRTLLQPLLSAVTDVITSPIEGVAP